MTLEARHRRMVARMADTAPGPISTVERPRLNEPLKRGLFRFRYRPLGLPAQRCYPHNVVTCARHLRLSCKLVAGQHFRLQYLKVVAVVRGENEQRVFPAAVALDPPNRAMESIFGTQHGSN